MARLMILRELHEKALKRERVFRDKSNPLDSYSDNEILSRFRFSRNGVMKLLDYLNEDLMPARRCCSYPPAAQLLAALRFYATGTFQLAVGDTFIEQIPQSRVSYFIHVVTDSLIRRIPSIEAERKEVNAGFFLKCGIPNTIGCID